MSDITEIRGIEILDSRGNPTVAADVTLASGARGCAAAPLGCRKTAERRQCRLAPHGARADRVERDARPRVGQKSSTSRPASRAVSLATAAAGRVLKGPSDPVPRSIQSSLSAS